MKQVLQHLDNGNLELADVPVPQFAPDQVLIRTCKSLISVGTEKMLVEFGKASYLSKARQQPEKVKQVFDKVQTDGMLATYEAVRGKLDEAIPLGYSNVGIIEALGDDVEGLRVGQRVVSNGFHAEAVAVSKRLCVPIPDTVSDEDASFAVLGAISLQGVRLAMPTIGETFVVIGLGLLGLIAAQLLRASGCRVLVHDIDGKRLEFAASLGFEKITDHISNNPVKSAHQLTGGIGVDGVVISASTQSNDPISQAAKMCRKRGRIILVGVTGLSLNRADFYEKELTFQVSCSYGPGRYDPLYEGLGTDYPIGYVRWTAQRNLTAFLRLLESESITMSKLITHRFQFEDAAKAYSLVSSSKSSILGIVLDYHQGKKLRDPRKSIAYLQKGKNKFSHREKVSVGMIGAGNYAAKILSPAFARANAKMTIICSQGGVSAARLAKKNGFENASTDLEEVLADKNTNAIVIATRHNSHAELTSRALSLGKHVFVEKPLALSSEELSQIKVAFKNAQKSRMPKLMVGFNRRYAPLMSDILRLVSSTKEPKVLIYTVNAGELPDDHWTLDPKIGGGRLVGEACHFLDLMRFIVGASVKDWELRATKLNANTNGQKRDQSFSVVMNFFDGSIGTLNYVIDGHRSFPKERLDIFVAGKSLHLDNFRSLKAYGWGQFKGRKLLRQNKGQTECVQSFVSSITQKTTSLIPPEQLFEIAELAISMQQELEK